MDEQKTDMAFKTTGCTWLGPVSEQVGVPLDQVSLSNFTTEFDWDLVLG